MLQLIVHLDQTASIKGWTINVNIRLLPCLHDVITYANVNSLPLAVISVDQMKALDCVPPRYLLRILERFAFGPSLLGGSRLYIIQCQVLSRQTVGSRRFVSRERIVARLSLINATLHSNSRDNGSKHQDYPKNTRNRLP